ncbi:hypothetical protein [Desertivirga arenae]|uniref:hypothetical protein n=1 Tax=Desertivirga arenae TaxID=2810309 RepID=UPI001A961F81|nr:hypothetical protein [Pedobacter sp. SYSU D00823]
MGRNIRTFTLTLDILRSNLDEILIMGQEKGISFSKYISGKIERHADGLNQDILIQNLEAAEKEVNVELISLVFKWLLEMNSQEEDFEFLKKYGFDLVSEIDEKDQGYIYISEMYDYVEMNGLKEVVQNYDSFKLYPSETFCNYLDYLILLLSKICLDKEYKNNMDYDQEEELFFKNCQSNEVLDAQTELALKVIRLENQAVDEEDPDNLYWRSESTSHYVVSQWLFYRMKKLRQLLHDYNGLIFIVDDH